MDRFVRRQHGSYIWNAIRKLHDQFGKILWVMGLGSSIFFFLLILENEGGFGITSLFGWVFFFFYPFRMHHVYHCTGLSFANRKQRGERKRERREKTKRGERERQVKRLVYTFHYSSHAFYMHKTIEFWWKWA